MTTSSVLDYGASLWIRSRRGTSRPLDLLRLSVNGARRRWYGGNRPSDRRTDRSGLPARRWVAATAACASILGWGWTQTPVEAASAGADLVEGFGILFAASLPPGAAVSALAGRFGSRSPGARTIAWLARTIFGGVLGILVYVTWFWGGTLWCEDCPDGTTSGSRLVGCAAAAFVLAFCAWFEDAVARRTSPRGQPTSAAR